MHNGGLIREVWRSFKPSLNELVVLLAVLFIVLAVSAYKVAINGEVGQDSIELMNSLELSRDTLFDFINQNEGLGRVFLFGFWFFVGAITYIFTWSAISSLVNLRRDINISDRYVHPDSFHKSDYWGAIIGRTVVRLAASLSLLLFLIFTFTGLSPVWVNTTKVLFINGWTVSHIASFLLTIIIMGVSIHVCAILLRYALLRPHYSYDD